MCFVCFWRTWFRRAGRASAERPSTLGERQRRARRRRRRRALFLLYVVDALSLVRCAPAASTPLVGSLVGLPVGRITTPASRGLGVAARRAGPPHALGRAVPPAHDPPRRRTPGEIERVVGEETNRSAPFPPTFCARFHTPAGPAFPTICRRHARYGPSATVVVCAPPARHGVPGRGRDDVCRIRNGGRLSLPRTRTQLARTPGSRATALDCVSCQSRLSTNEP